MRFSTTSNKNLFERMDKMSFLGNDKKVVALGIFDGMHIAHRKVVKEVAQIAKSEGKAPALFTFLEEDTPAGKNGAKFIISEELKNNIIKNLGVSDIYAFPFETIKNLSAEEFLDEIIIGKIGGDHIVCGYDFRCGKKASCDADMLSSLCEARGIKLTVIEKIDEGGSAISSTRIRKAVQEGDTEAVSKLLGFPFPIEGAVVQGKQLGREYGFPTINQILPKNITMPRFGVYASIVYYDGKLYEGVTNVGVKPTVCSDFTPLAETNIFDFDKDIYGETVLCFLVAFIREEKSFESKGALFCQIAKDKISAKTLLADKKSVKEDILSLFTSIKL